MIVIKQIKMILVSIVIAYVPSLFIIAVLIGGNIFFDTPFIFDLLIVFLYTFPIIVGAIVFLLCLVRVIDNEKKYISVYNLITMFTSLSVIVITFAFSEHIYVSIVLAVLLLVLEIAHCVKVKSIINVVQFFKQTLFWVIVFCILLSVTLCSSVYRFMQNDDAHADPIDYAWKNSDGIEESYLEALNNNWYKCDIIVNLNSVQDYTGNDLMCTLMHEIAHALKLTHVEDNILSIMGTSEEFDNMSNDITFFDAAILLARHGY